ncbi:MAG: hypothetical protein COA79_08450 [Planctomycetota bacterium]|nr:MAG: hypothetical protein COA79_08450 [Planctomycetota bacterium]
MNFVDGPASKNFTPVSLTGNCKINELKKKKYFSNQLKSNLDKAPSGDTVSWGIPFSIKSIFHVEKTITIKLPRKKSSWIIFNHTTDFSIEKIGKDGVVSPPSRGHGRINEKVAVYQFEYTDGTIVEEVIKRRYQIGMIQRFWGINNTLSVSHRKPHSFNAAFEVDGRNEIPWGTSITRSQNCDMDSWMNWIWAWENPHPKKTLKSITAIPTTKDLLIFGVTVGNASQHPLRWHQREKCVIKLPNSIKKVIPFDKAGKTPYVNLDMGQIISMVPRLIYPNKKWKESRVFSIPKTDEKDWVVEYSAHPDAVFHLASNSKINLKELKKRGTKNSLKIVEPSHQRVNLKVIDKDSKKPVAVKIHLHGEVGEYLCPVDRHRIINAGWNEDIAPEQLHEGLHQTTYINGDTIIDLPVGNVYIEVSKGFEIKSIRKVFKVTKGTKQITITIQKVLPWREKGWVTADTHVHFLSPTTAHLEGSAEGVNVVNLLSSQWGEYMSNVGDFDGKNTWGSKENGGDGEFLVRVGTENRQHVMGHISLLGYSGNMISPMCAGGSDEAAIGDPVDVLLSQWAKQCKDQGGLVIMPHFPHPRMENAAAIINGHIDAIELCSWGDLYSGISPYTLSDWYRYLNCGIFIPAVGGTDKMSAETPIGAIRTYAHIPKSKKFTYDNWMRSIENGHTFVSYGPLMEFSVDGKHAGQNIKMTSKGGTLSAHYELASANCPMHSIELIVNGEIREEKKISKTKAEGYFSIKVDRSSWVALRVRGKYKDKPVMLAAHSSPVLVYVKDKPFKAAADAMTILEQLEGTMAYFETLATRPEEKLYKQLKLEVTAAHQKFHHHMHHMGIYHDHTHTQDHPEHHK